MSVLAKNQIDIESALRAAECSIFCPFCLSTETENEDWQDGEFELELSLRQFCRCCSQSFGMIDIITSSMIIN